MTVALLGASGKTGRAITAALAHAGHEVRGLGRADLGDLAGAIRGCEAVYLLAPNLHPGEPAYIEEALLAARDADVSRVVYHSVAAPYAPSMPHHLGKAVSEDLVRRSGLAWTILQPGAYVQNFVPALTAPSPRIEVAYDPEARFGLVDLADLGEAAAIVLASDTHAGATFELGGPRPVSVRDVARVAGELLGRQVPVEQLSLAQWARRTTGMTLRERDWLAAMFGYYDAHGLPVGGLALQVLLGRPPHDLRETLARELCR